jgi:Zn-dependent oligopeptidase
VKAGANLSEADKAKLKKLNEEEATLENTFHEQAAGGRQGGRVLDHGRKRRSPG